MDTNLFIINTKCPPGVTNHIKGLKLHPLQRSKAITTRIVNISRCADRQTKVNRRLFEHQVEKTDTRANRRSGTSGTIKGTSHQQMINKFEQMEIELNCVIESSDAHTYM